MIVSEDSVLYKSKQAWKYKLALLMGWLALLALIGYLYFSYSLGMPSTVWLVVGIMFSAVAFYLDFQIKCPSCGSRWYWQYLKKPVKKDWGWRFGLMKSCQVCGYKG